MKPIGGFFELEIKNGHSLYHDDALKLSTGRACLNYALKTLNPTKVYLPFYCCNALYEPMVINEIPFEFYAIDTNLEILDFPKVEANEVIVYCDFFGIKSEYTNTLVSHYGAQLIIDNTHSFFLKAYEKNFAFTSARKYFGVPDGAFLYLPEGFKNKMSIPRNENISIAHNLDRLMGFQQKAFSEFLEYEDVLGSEIKLISIISEKLLSNVDYTSVRKQRNDNFEFYKNNFGSVNNLNIDDNEQDAFCYPLLLDRSLDKKKLSELNIFIPNLWVEIKEREVTKAFDYECKISTELLPLPIDHRYTTEELAVVVEHIKNLMQ